MTTNNIWHFPFEFQVIVWFENHSLERQTKREKNDEYKLGWNQASLES